MLRLLVPLAMLLTISACGQQAPTETSPSATFRTDPDLTPLPLDSLLASASDAGSQYAELIQEPGPDGPVAAVFAHAPTNMVVAVPTNSSELVVDFGIREAAYTGAERTTGVCFIVSGGNDLAAMNELWRRCLTPADVEADRGMHEHSIALPVQTTLLRFSTAAAVDGQTNFGWSYWGNPRVH